MECKEQEKSGRVRGSSVTRPPTNAANNISTQIFRLHDRTFFLVKMFPSPTKKSKISLRQRAAGSNFLRVDASTCGMFRRAQEEAEPLPAPHSNRPGRSPSIMLRGVVGATKRRRVQRPHLARGGMHCFGCVVVLSCNRTVPTRDGPGRAMSARFMHGGRPFRGAC